MTVTANMQQKYPTVKLKTPPGFVNDKTKDGWKLIENVELVGEPTITLAKFLQPGENSVGGETMLERAKALGNCAGQLHAERLLVQQADVPEEYRQYYLIFPGTVWQDSDSNRRVPYLRWDDDRWYLRFWLDHDHWSARDRLVCLC